MTYPNAHPTRHCFVCPELRFTFVNMVLSGDDIYVVPLSSFPVSLLVPKSAAFISFLRALFDSELVPSLPT